MQLFLSNACLSINIESACAYRTVWHSRSTNHTINFLLRVKIYSFILQNMYLFHVVDVFNIERLQFLYYKVCDPLPNFKTQLIVTILVEHIQ
ncbi:hypothetical protein GDO86_011134 [Hymenochirus boettgeri]|uniref:Uncharacterized protein n=1 Tax=Hymenochirus boettgeri TaxID=247094 RepID=A0A8T2JF65_9PIPI|nr:hypothetical protein GDO86_011134 [Hymenochirus boettgeri]